MENRIEDERYYDLLCNILSLYFNETLAQYGLSDRAARKIVSNVTGLTIEQIEEVRKKVYENGSPKINKSSLANI